MASGDSLSYYENNSENLSGRYEAASVEALQLLLKNEFTGRKRLLELGSGTCRDAAYLVKQGHEVIALDGSEAMNQRAVSLHPEMAGNIITHNIILPLPFKDNSFDGAFSLATLMHFNDDELSAILDNISRTLRPESPFIISVPLERKDLDSRGFDSMGRFFNMKTKVQWQELIEGRSFAVSKTSINSDGLCRDGIRWMNVVSVKK